MTAVFRYAQLMANHSRVDTNVKGLPRYLASVLLRRGPRRWF